MRVLLKDGAEKATAETILVLPQGLDLSLETLSGEAVPFGLLAEADRETVVQAVNDGAEDRQGDGRVTPQQLHRDVKWLDKATAEFEIGSKIGLEVRGEKYRLDASAAIRIDRAEELTKGDRVAIGPTISPRAYMNAHGRVVAVKGKKVEVELDAGDRDRFVRATGKRIGKSVKFPRTCIEKIAAETD